MNNENLDFKKKYKIVAKHVEDFIKNDISIAMDYFPFYYYAPFYSILEEINCLYNKLELEEKKRYVEVITTLSSQNNFKYCNLFPQNNDLEKDMLEKMHEEYLLKYYRPGGDIAPYDREKLTTMKPELNAKELKREINDFILNRFKERRLLSNKRQKIHMIEKAYLFPKKDDENDVLWIVVDFYKKSLAAGFGRKDYNLYVDHQFFLFEGYFTYYVKTLEELLFKMETICEWLKFMYPRYKDLFDKLVYEYGKNRSEKYE